jgi:hypothetical protein
MELFDLIRDGNDATISAYLQGNVDLVAIRVCVASDRNTLSIGDKQV